ncbi:MAG TPA: chaplin family protein, partial [Lapillicoccus sp.]|nr:chaplin family protein [Lapillicoccus sp.]
MHTFIKRALLGVVIGGGLALGGASLAHADETSGDDGLLSGTQAVLGVDLPITIGGNGISVIGDSASTGTPAAAPAAPAAPAPAAPASTSGNDSVGGGTQALVNVAVPVTVGGNSVSVLGDSDSANAGNTTPAGTQPAGTTPTTTGDDGILGGTQAVAPITAPVTLGGNAISVLGDSDTAAGTTTPAGTQPTGTTPTTAGNDGIFGGTQAAAPITAPVTVSGNSISAIG